jgi:hypothetical protein
MHVAMNSRHIAARRSSSDLAKEDLDLVGVPGAHVVLVRSIPQHGGPAHAANIDRRQENLTTDLLRQPAPFGSR